MQGLIDYLSADSGHKPAPADVICPDETPAYPYNVREPQTLSMAFASCNF